MSETKKPDSTAFIVDILFYLNKYFDKDEAKILDWLRTTKPELNDLAPVELIATGKAEHLLAYIVNNLRLEQPGS